MPTLQQSRPSRASSLTRGLLRGCALAVTTLALVAAPTLASGLTSAAPGHVRKGSTQTVGLSGIDPQGARQPGAVSAAAPVGPTARSHATTAGAGTAAGGTTAVTAPVTVPGDVAVVGASWPAASTLPDGAQLQVRTRTAGAWGGWQPLDADDSHGPDTTGPGAAEGRRARAGTEPFVVTGADAVQVRVEGAAPAAQTQVEVVDPGEQAADPTVGQQRPDAAAAEAAQPTIYSRKSWGADESLRKGTVEYGSVQAAFVHHTAGTNDYTAAQVPAIIRGIYSFHVNGRGWNDIGYNFLVDKFGRIWEGRYGGVALPVVGAHTKGYNSLAFAMSAMGNFDTARPTSAMVSAYSRLFAWKMSLHGIPATGAVTLAGTPFNRINGHRDAAQTDCPGTYLYAQLNTIRAQTKARMGTLSRPGVARSLDPGGTPDLLARSGSGSASVLAEATSAVSTFARIGSSWQSLSLVTASPDLSGDGRPDLVARDGTGALRIYRGDGHGGFAGSSVNGSGWGSFSRLVAPGDLDGDGHADLVAVTAGGVMRLYPGDGHGWFGASQVIGGGWQAMSLLTAAGDVTGDGVPDLFAVRASDGQLLRYPGNGTGAFAAPASLGGGWTAFDRAVGGGDLDGDGHPDLLVRQSGTGRMRTYYGIDGGVRWPLTWGSGFQAVPTLTGGVDWDGDGTPDLFGIGASGDLTLYRGSAAREYGQARASGVDLTGTDLSAVLGDLDRDGRSDVVARDAADGSLYLYPEPGTGSPSPARIRLGGGWQSMDLIAPAGDLDRDGVPDLLARDSATQTLWVYPMTAAGGFRPRRVLGTSWSSIRDVVGVGAFDSSDAAPDVVALLSTGELRLYTGNGPGRLTNWKTLLTGSGVADLVGAGDVDGDGRADVIAVDTSDGLVSFAQGSGGTLGSARPLVRDASTTGASLG